METLWCRMTIEVFSLYVCVLFSIVMAIITSGYDRKINAELYKALFKGEDAKVTEICGGLPDGPLHILTIHKDTVLHMASYQKRNKLILELLSKLPETLLNKLTTKNSGGDTILHETATNNGTVEAAEEMLCRAPSLLSMTNNRGETALFHAARYGKSDMFRFLNAQVMKTVQKEADIRAFLLRNDKATILHISILSGNFNLAHDIAKTYPSLVGEEDEDGMTGLHLLACSPLYFDNGAGDGFFKGLIYKFIDSSRERTSRVPMLKEIQKQKFRCESGNELARLLIESDTSWEVTEIRSNQNRSKIHKFKGSTSTEEQRDENARTPDTPLLLATKSGCTEIVKRILEVYPQAVEHIDENGRNILHVATKYRRKEIIDTLINMEYPVARLRRKIDRKGNSILHMVGMKVEDPKAEEDIRSPALVLRDDLLLFEKVSNICTTSTTIRRNQDGDTAEQLFAKNNAKLRIDAKEWMKSTAEHSSIVAVLIATVAFAAAYTVPGGPDQRTGYPLLKKKSFFIIFALTDALSLTFALTSVIIFLSILTSSFRLKDFRNSLHHKLLLGLTVLILSVSMMMVAFAATLILTISSGKNWTNVALYIISFFPVTVFVCSYVHLYKSLVTAFMERLKNMIKSVRPVHKVELSSGPRLQALNTTLNQSTASSLV